MNYRIFRTINDWSGNGFLDAVMKVAAKDLIFVVFVVFAVLGLLAVRRGGIRAGVGAAVTVVVAFALGLVAAAVHKERRPFERHHVHQLIAHAGGQSFPSDHATAAAALALAATFFLSRRWGVVLLVAAVVIGFARVYDGIHYPGDILGSFLVALLAVPVGLFADRYVRPAPRR